MHLRRLTTSQVGPPRLLPERHRVQAWSWVRASSQAQAWLSAEAGLRMQTGLRAQAWSSAEAGLRMQTGLRVQALSWAW